MGNRSYPGTVLGDVVGAAAWGSKIYTMRGGWMAASRCVRCMQCLCWVMVVFVVLRLRFNDSAPSTGVL